MTLHTSDDTETMMADCDCHHCHKTFPVPSCITVSHEEMWESLENGTLLDVECPHCGKVEKVDRMVDFSIPDWCIGELFYIPVHALNSDDVCEFLLDEEKHQTTYYSIEELVHQVKARSRLVEYVFQEMKDHPEYIPYRWPHLS